MPKSGIHINTSQVDALSSRLKSALVGKDRSKLVHALERSMQQAVGNAFNMHRDPRTLAPWAQRKTSVPWGLLHKTGALQHSIKTKVKVGKVNLWPMFLVSGTGADIRKAYVHYYGRRVKNRKGGPHGGGPMPVRRMAGLSQSQQGELRSLAAKLIKDAIKGRH